jgi:ligand-binding sensor domain-containing protein
MGPFMNRAVAHDPVGPRRSTLPRARPIRSSPRRRITLLGACLAAVMSVARPVHALDPAKRLTQYLHTSWRIEDGTAPAGMNSIAQSADGFLWFSAFSQELYRFDGVRFVPRTLSVDGKTVNPIVQVDADSTGGLWALGMHQVLHLKGGVVVSQFELPGLMAHRRPVENPDGSVWIVRGFANVTREPLCRVSDQGVRCFGAADGIPIPEAFSLLADGAGGFWIGGQRVLVHWRQGTSQVYPIKSLENNM